MESSVFRLSTKLVALYPKSVIRISLCRTTQRNPNDRFGLMEFDNYHSMFFPPYTKLRLPVLNNVLMGNVSFGLSTYMILIIL